MWSQFNFQMFICGLSLDETKRRIEGMCYTTPCYTVQHPHLAAACRHCPSFPQHTCLQSAITMPYLSRGSPASRRQFVLLFTIPVTSDPVNPPVAKPRLPDYPPVAKPRLPDYPPVAEPSLPDYPPVAEPCCRLIACLTARLLPTHRLSDYPPVADTSPVRLPACCRPIACPTARLLPTHRLSDCPPVADPLPVRLPACCRTPACPTTACLAWLVLIPFV